ncbi:ribonuclease H-like protein, partial [Schizopora paradoxa]
LPDDVDAAVRSVCAGVDAVALDVECVRGTPVLVQLASKHGIALCRMSAWNGNCPGALQELLTGKDVAKVGANILGDAALLQTAFDLEVRNCRELSLMAKAIDRGAWCASSADPAADIALSKLCAAYLHSDLDKTLTTSDWTADPLSAEQIRYAASDVAVVRDVAGLLMRHPSSCSVDANLYSWRLYQGKRYRNDTERGAGRWKVQSLAPR